MPVYFASKSIIPAPTVDIRRNYIKTNDGVTIGKIYDITVNGKMLAYKGSPNSSGVFWADSSYPPDEQIAADDRLDAIQKKQQALRQLFSKVNEGQTFEIQGWNGAAPVKFNPRIISIEFPNDYWYEYFDYVITLQADQLYGSPTILPNDEDTFIQYLQDASESWSIELAEPENEQQQQTFRLSHNLSAVGKTTFDSTGISLGDAWTQAKSWCTSRLGLDLSVIFGSGILNVPSYFTGFNQVRTENIDKNGGSFSTTETWTLASGSAIEDFTVAVTSGINDGLIKVSLNGNILGMETRNSDYQITQTKYQAANTKFGQVIGQFLNRAQTYANVTLNNVPVETVVGRNPVAGSINYSYEYDTRSQPYTAGAKSEIVTISDQGGTDVVARIGILGRSVGPIFQPISTITETTRNISIELIMPSVSSNNPADWLAAKPDVSGLIQQLKPIASQVYTIENPDSWTPRNGRYSKNVTFLFQ